jgi:hypothetical protein
MGQPFLTADVRMRKACAHCWHTYFESMLALHEEHGRTPEEPTENRNLGTTGSRHVRVFEEFWRNELASALKVPASDVGPRIVRFRPHRAKQFDVCWPLDGEPKILISIKTMQNAYRNFTNRIEEALGDSAVVRLYRLRAAYGFFFFMLDGSVPRGRAEPGVWVSRDKSNKQKRFSPFLDVLEEGGDFFSLENADEYRKRARGKTRGRQDAVALAEQSLIDLIATEPSIDGSIHYDNIAFLPTRIRRRTAFPKLPKDWAVRFSPVDERLNFRSFVNRLVDVAKFRKLIYRWCAALIRCAQSPIRCPLSRTAPLRHYQPLPCQPLRRFRRVCSSISSTRSSGVEHKCAGDTAPESGENHLAS